MGEEHLLEEGELLQQGVCLQLQQGVLLPQLSAPVEPSVRSGQVNSGPAAGQLTALSAALGRDELSRPDDRHGAQGKRHPSQHDR